MVEHRYLRYLIISLSARSHAHAFNGVILLSVHLALISVMTSGELADLDSISWKSV